MTALVNLPFAQTFTFSRSIKAERRRADGSIAEMPVNKPRFDHAADGTRLGLKVEMGPYLGQNDRLSPIHQTWETDKAATALLEWQDIDGVVRRLAIYTMMVGATVQALLNTQGHLRQIGAVPGFLRNMAPVGAAGYVRYKSARWGLGSLLGGVDGALIVDDRQRVMIESH